VNEGIEMSAEKDLAGPAAHLSPAKQALLKKWRKGNFLPRHDADSIEVAVISKRNERDPVPLSCAQQRLWSLNRSLKENHAYNFPFGDYLLQGELNIPVLRQSIREIVQRHEILRTTFTEQRGQGIPMIHPRPLLTFEIVKLEHLPASRRMTEAKRIALEQMRYCFNLTNESLVRSTLLVLSEHEHVLILNAHRIVFDGWSRGIFFRELSILYTALVTSNTPQLQELPIQYADFAIWQRQWLQGNVLTTQLDYWKHQLHYATTILELPTDYVRPPLQRYESRFHSVKLAPAVAENLKSFCQRENVTLLMVFITAFSVLFYRYTGQNDILIGTPIANRNQAQIEKLIGNFVNTLLIRTQLSEQLNVRELLERVRNTVLEAFAHQMLPFEKLLEEVPFRQEANRSPMAQVMVILHDVPLPPLKLGELDMHSLDLIGEGILHDLVFTVLKTEAGFDCFVRYNSDLFHVSTITVMLRNWLMLLEEITTNSHQRISNLSALQS